MPTTASRRARQGTIVKTAIEVRRYFRLIVSPALLLVPFADAEIVTVPDAVGETDTVNVAVD